MAQLTNDSINVENLQLPFFKKAAFCWSFYTDANISNTTKLPLEILKKYLSTWESQQNSSTEPYYYNYFQRMKKSICDFTGIYQSQINISQALISEYVVVNAETNPDAGLIISNLKEVESMAIELIDSLDFEDSDSDVDYIFTNGIANLINHYSKVSLYALSNLINSKEIEPKPLNELLKALGRIKDQNTQNYRFNILVNCLQHEVAFIRDGAIAGLSLMDDKEALEYLKIALERETIATLKENIKVAINDLERI